MILQRYVTKEIYLTMIATTLILLVIFISNQFAHYLKIAAVGHLTAKSVLELMAIQVPLLLGILLPLGLFIGIMLTYGRLYVDNEMTVLMASGFSQTNLLVVTLKLTFFVALAVAVLMLWVEPNVAFFREHIYAQGQASPIERLLPRKFQTLDKGQYVLYVDHIARDHQSMSGIFIAKQSPQKDIQQPTNWDVVVAKKASMKHDPVTHNNYILLSTS